MYELIANYGMKGTVIVLGLPTALVVAYLIPLVRSRWIRERLELLWGEVRYRYSS